MKYNLIKFELREIFTQYWTHKSSDLYVQYWQIFPLLNSILGGKPPDTPVIMYWQVSSK
jgi:hypothetical protein